MITAALIGAGGRGMATYANYALEHAHQIKFVSLADPNKEKRKVFSNLHQISPDMVFENWEDLLEKERFCDAIFICSPDKDHYEQAMKAIEKGYNIVLEKPMSPEPKETLEIAQFAQKQNVLVTVCHVMRYGPYFRALKEILDKKEIGNIISIQWTENVGFWHYAHSYVRGNWKKSEESSPMILAKSCHDMDMLQWLIGSNCSHVSSFGNLTHFKEQNAPEGSTSRCTDGCKVEQECVYSAMKQYHHDKDEYFTNVVCLEKDINKRFEALLTGPYGKCVYRNDNNVVDNQVVNLLFENGVTVAFTMTAFTTEICRSFHIVGTKGEIKGHELQNELEIKHFTGKIEKVYPEKIDGGHSGADTMFMMDFINGVNNSTTENTTSAVESAKSHMIAFAAEESRITSKTIEMKEYIKKFHK